MKQYLCLLALLCLFIKAGAQEKPANSGLSIGDEMPEVLLENMLNHPAGQALLSDYRGKWLILDFWATWCSPCIAMFPKTDSLQEAFAGKVQFLAVTYQEESKVSRLFNKLSTLKGLHPPIVLEDSILGSLFPHRSLPHYVWISPAGKVAAITGMEEITAENIETMMGKGGIAIRQKQDEFARFIREEPLLASNQALSKRVLYQSAFMGYINGLPGSHTIFPADSVKGLRVVATNANLPHLYKIAYGLLEGIYFSRNRIILEADDTTRLSSPLTGKAYVEWKKQNNSFCYELIVPPALLGQAAEIMQQDMERMFPQYRVEVEIRKRPVLALVRMTEKDKLRSKDGPSFVEFTAYGAQIRNQYLGTLTTQLNAKYMQDLSRPVIDRSGYTDRVDMKLEAKLSDLASVRKALKAYGLDLVKQEEEIKVLVIRDSSPKG